MLLCCVSFICCSNGKSGEDEGLQPAMSMKILTSSASSVTLRVESVNASHYRILCAATIEGRRPEPRSVTQQQWQRMWLAEDRDDYKLNLAAALFADVLRKGQARDNSVETAASAERKPEQSEQEEQKTGMKR